MHVDIFDSQRSHARDAGLVCTTTQHRNPTKYEPGAQYHTHFAVSVVEPAKSAGVFTRRPTSEF